MILIGLLTPFRLLTYLELEPDGGVISLVREYHKFTMVPPDVSHLALDQSRCFER